MRKFAAIGCWFAGALAVFVLPPAFADDVRLHYDRSGNLVATQNASATTLTVEDVRPGYGAAGEAVTIVGAGFAATPTANSVQFSAGASAVGATVGTAASSALAVTVPSGATTGPLSVSVGAATAQSPAPFVILPPGVGASQISSATRLALDGPGRDVAALNSLWALESFDLPANKYATLQFSAFSGSSISTIGYSIYGPGGSLFASGNVGPASPTILLPLTAAAGTYALYLKPQGWFKAHVALSSDPQWTVDGSSLTLASSLPNQRQRAWFNGGAASNLSYAYTGLSIAPTSAGYPQIGFFKPDGSALTSLINLPSSGAYSVVLTPSSSANATSEQLWLSSEVTGTLAMNVPQAIAVTRYGQHARYTFSGTQGQNVRFATSNTHVLPNEVRVATYVFNPDGSQLLDGAYFVSTSNGNSTASAQLPATGTYTVFMEIDPYDDPNSIWSMTLNVTADVSATIVVDGDPTTVSTSGTGQQVRATFSATAGQNLAFAYTNFSIAPSGAGYPSFTTYKPDGTVLSSFTNLPQTGTYTLVITFPAATTATSMQLWLSTEATGTLAFNTPTPIGVTRYGQHARYTFNGTQGQNVRFATSNTHAAPTEVRVSTYIYNPDGSTLLDGTSFVSTSNGNSTASAQLPATGTYTVFMQVDPYDDPNSTWSTTLNLTADVAATIVVDGDPTTAATNGTGQRVRATFSATAGQNLGFAYTNFSITPAGAGYPSFTIFRPDGAALSSFTNLPQTGTYTLLITYPDATTASSIQLWLSTEATGTLQVNAANPLSVSRPGQSGRYTFDGTQGQNLRFAAASTTTTPNDTRVAIYAYRPDGSTFLFPDQYFNATSNGTTAYGPVTLPQTGTYTVLVRINVYDNPNTSWSTTLTPTTDLPATIVVDGTPTNISTSLPGQEVRATFDATAGQNLGFAYTDLSFTPASSGYPSFSTYDPDGNFIGSWQNLPKTGTYTMLITPQATTTAAGATLWLSTELTGTLALNTATPIAVTRYGQHARYTFTGTQGQVLKFTADSTSTTPASNAIAVYAYDPNGASIISGNYFVATSNGSNSSTTSALTSTGTYTVYIAMNPYSNSNSTWSTTLTVAPQ